MPTATRPPRVLPARAKPRPAAVVVCPLAPAGLVEACRLCRAAVSPPAHAGPALALGAAPVCPGCAANFVADRAASRRLRAAARRRPAAPTASEPPKPPPARIDPEPHLKWARAIARGVRADYRFPAGSQEEQDLESTAYLWLVQLAAAYDPARCPPGGDHGGLFRGYSAQTIRKQCQYEAVRLRNGGTYHTRRESGRPPVHAEPLSRLFTPAGDPFDPADRTPDPDTDED